MSYVLSGLGTIAAPPPEPTASALLILGTCAAAVAPIALVAAGARIASPKSGAVAPIVGGLVGTVISVLLIRGKILDGSASVSPRSA